MKQSSIAPKRGGLIIQIPAVAKAKDRLQLSSRMPTSSPLNA